MANGPYHHGDLPRTLVRCALDQLERDGAAGLSLRGVAREAGVSPMAVYHHFRSKDELLRALVAAGFAEHARRQRACLEAETTREGALIGLARVYVASALEHPELFRLMVGHESISAPFAAERAASIDRLREVILSGPATGHPPDARATAAAAWAFTHGLASLVIDGVLRPQALGLDDVDALVVSLTRAFWQLAPEIP